MAARVFCRIPLDYLEGFGEYEPDQEGLDHEIGNLLPDCLAWCGDELLVELDDDGDIPAELDGFDINEVIDKAYERLFARWE